MVNRHAVLKNKIPSRVGGQEIQDGTGKVETLKMASILLKVKCGATMKNYYLARSHCNSVVTKKIVTCWNY